MKTLLVIGALLAMAFLWPRPADPLPGFPHVFLWAWERPENLEFLDPHATGVAFLARTVCLRGGAVSVRPRQQPLRYPPGAVLMAVVRVDPQNSDLPPVDATAAAIAEAAAIPEVRALQVDFDATLSQRGYYRELLADLRRPLALIDAAVYDGAHVLVRVGRLDRGIARGGGGPHAVSHGPRRAAGAHIPAGAVPIERRSFGG